MISPSQLRKSIAVAVMLALAFAAVGWRLVQLQVSWRERLRDLAQDNTRRVFARAPRRGDIRDIRGNLLATSVFVKTVCVDPAFAGTNQLDIARAIAPILQTNESFVLEKLQPRILRWDTNNQPVIDRHVVLKRKVRLDEWDKIEAVMAGLCKRPDEKKLKPREKSYLHSLRNKVVFSEEDQLRLYPGDNLASHVVGFLGMVDQETPDGKVTETVGRDGIERLLDNKLRGVRGWRRTEMDKSRREMINFREEDVEPQPGRHVVLTIDSALQHIVESELAAGFANWDPVSISSIVVRPKTGEILALACLPDFNPNRPGDVPPANLRNRPILDFVEPGSTFKIVVVSGALNDGLVTLNDIFDCEGGRFYYGGRTLHDHKAYGLLSVENIIAKSSNIGAAKIGIQMGQERLFSYVKKFGFGERTGIPLPGESVGLVNALKHWSKTSIASVPMGHEIGVTQIQMAMAMSAIANHGVLMRPLLVDRLEDDAGRVLVKMEPQIVRQVVSTNAAALMVEALKQVPTTNGTAKAAKLDLYTVAGKTGTAQKAGPNGGGYSNEKFVTSFIGFFPADDPELCIAVMLDEPKKSHLGGEVAAPIFHEIAERAANYLNITPTRTTAAPGPQRARPQMLATGTPATRSNSKPAE
ncbi:MAG TPA: penicillin-binding protein 2 [Verrucomicrobiae bacterium]|nr:penicillin-binding protein 2 [Verrucomicrobiae bacterium]